MYTCASLHRTRENSRTNKCTLRAARMSNVLVFIVVAAFLRSSLSSSFFLLSSLQTLSFGNEGRRWLREITGVQETLTPSVVRRIRNGEEQEEDRTDGRRRMGSAEREYGIIFVARSH